MTSRRSFNLYRVVGCCVLTIAIAIALLWLDPTTTPAADAAGEPAPLDATPVAFPDGESMSDVCVTPDQPETALQDEQSALATPVAQDAAEPLACESAAAETIPTEIPTLAPESAAPAPIEIASPPSAETSPDPVDPTTGESTAPSPDPMMTGLALPDDQAAAAESPKTDEPEATQTPILDGAGWAPAPVPSDPMLTGLDASLASQTTIAEIAIDAFSVEGIVTPGEQMTYGFRFVNTGANPVTARVVATTDSEGWRAEVRWPDGSGAVTSAQTFWPDLPVALLVVVTAPDDSVAGESASTTITLVESQP